MFNEARRAQPLPKRLSCDHDPLFRVHRWRANLRILDIEEIKCVPFMPRSHPFIERLIGTLRREHLDQVFFWNGLDLHRKLDRFAAYYNQRRVHAGHKAGWHTGWFLPASSLEASNCWIDAGRSEGKCMAALIVDTNILLDIYTQDQTWEERSAAACGGEFNLPRRTPRDSDFIEPTPRDRRASDQ
jgi:hypothetical protein